MVGSKKGIPDDSLACGYLPVNYYDVIDYTIDNADNITADSIQIAIWTVMPVWVENLFKLRNLLVRPFGLKSGGKDRKELRQCIETGGSTDMVTELGKTPNETLIRLDDRHLQAYLSIYIQNIDAGKRCIKAITLVKFRSWLGYVYFYAIMPFHKIVVKRMLKFTVDNLINSQKT